MPITTSAKQALRKDRRRNITNNRIRAKLRTSIKTFQTKKDPTLIPELYSILDIAAKKKIIHHNKAARLKSQFNDQAKIAATETKTTTTKAPKAKKTSKSTSKTKTTTNKAPKVKKISKSTSKTKAN